MSTKTTKKDTYAPEIYSQCWTKVAKHSAPSSPFATKWYTASAAPKKSLGASPREAFKRKSLPQWVGKKTQSVFLGTITVFPKRVKPRNSRSEDTHCLFHKVHFIAGLDKSNTLLGWPLDQFRKPPPQWISVLLVGGWHWWL